MSDIKNATNRQRGKVVSWRDEAGYGFIRGEDPRVGIDYFVHHSWIPGRKYLVPGMIVEFTPATNPRSGKTGAMDVIVTGLLGLTALGVPANPLAALGGPDDDARGNR